jgi:hypothetical protein
MTAKRELIINIGITILLIGFLVFCLMCSPARCDDVDAARQRLQAIEAERIQAAEVASAKASQAIAEQAASVAAGVTPEAIIEPTPDPISARKAPTISFSAVASEVRAARLPRAVMVCGQGCSPCLRMERENADLIGGPDMPIQIVKNWLANDLDEWGIAPSMQLGTPYVFVIGADGKVHGLTSAGLGCVLRGYQSREVLLAYLQHPDHKVDITPTTQPPVVATVADGDASPSTIAAVLSEHLIRASGQQVQTDVVGGLFDFDFDVPDNLRDLAAKLLTLQRYEFPSAGITLDWSGPSRSFVVTSSALNITPGMRVTVNKWRIKYSVSLDGITYTPDLSTVTLLLTGAPDLTVHLR